MKRIQNYVIGYVILHYQTIQDTRNCVASLKEIIGDNDWIIIVDNCSPNGSGLKLQEYYKKEKHFITILSEENLGFARGNNLGYYCAKYQLGCDFIILLNNDVLIRQTDFRSILIREYHKYEFDILGPKILKANGDINECSPMYPIHTNIRRARIGQISNYIRWILSYINMDILYGKMFDKNKMTNSNCAERYMEDVQISGCCIIFAPKYIQLFDGLNPDTFMYLEEILLYIRAKKAGLRIAFDPELEIVHLEDSATDAVFKENSGRKRRFKYKCQMKSFRVLLNEISVYSYKGKI